jgi:hypothetical protein
MQLRSGAQSNDVGEKSAKPLFAGGVAAEAQFQAGADFRHPGRWCCA